MCRKGSSASENAALLLLPVLKCIGFYSGSHLHAPQLLFFVQEVSIPSEVLQKKLFKWS